MTPPVAPPQPPEPSAVAARIRRALAAGAEALAREQEGVAASDPDAVHDMRVASRRIRETLRLSEPFLGPAAVTRLVRDGRRVTRALGGLREEQVSRELLGRIAAAAAKDRTAPEVEAAGFDFLLHRLDRRARKHFARAGRRLSRADLRRFERRLRVAAEHPADGALAAEASPLALVAPVARMAEELLQAAREHPSDENLHRLRVGVKHLRYAVEVLAGADGATFVRAMKQLQDLLGDYHDLAVLAEVVASERAKLVADRRLALAAALSSVHRRVAMVKRDALLPLERRLERLPAGSLERRSLRAVREAARRKPLAAVPAVPSETEPVAADALGVATDGPPASEVGTS